MGRIHSIYIYITSHIYILIFLFLADVGTLLILMVHVSFEPIVVH